MITKRFLSILIFLFVITGFIAAESGNIQFRYKLNKYVPEYVEVGFTDTSKKAITTYELDLSKRTDSMQVFLAVNTNKATDYTLNLTFFPMRSDDPSDPTFLGRYKAMVFDEDYVVLETSSTDNTLLVDDANGVSIAFEGAQVLNASKVNTFYYPISFDFTNYIEDYAVGTFTGSILVEVTTQ
ncbi:MAG: hypothetical protein MJ057_05965 [Sphaerochaetaceae bacterium]|nr:hypothetical protein [Sphaerochaetaceae bacterium]